jgi:hypothetical protein
MLLLVTCAVPALAHGSEATAVPISELVSMQSGLDGERVRFSGEVVSEQLRGGDGHVWLNVLSDGIAVGVWLPKAEADKVTAFGDWEQDGDVVEITGVLYEACDQHGGDLDIHGESLTVVSAGALREHPVGWWKIVPGLVGLVIAYIVIWRMRRREERPS